MHLFGITTANDDITAEQLALAQESGIRVCLWDIRKQKEHEDAFLKSPDFIQGFYIKFHFYLLLQRPGIHCSPSRP